MATSLAHNFDVTDAAESSEENSLTDMKARVAARQYEVDAASVADEILRKLRLLRWARRELATEPGRSPSPRSRPL